MPPTGRAYKTRHPKKAAFLAAYRCNGNVSASALAAGIHRVTFYDWLGHDEGFAAAVEDAAADATDSLELEARRRAAEGVESKRGIYDRSGRLVAEETEVKYSDTLLIFLLKGLRPDRYRERSSVEHSGPNSGPIRIDDAGLTNEERASRVMAILERARARRDGPADPTDRDMGAASGAADPGVPL